MIWWNAAAPRSYLYPSSLFSIFRDVRRLIGQRDFKHDAWGSMKASDQYADKAESSMLISQLLYVELDMYGGELDHIYMDLEWAQCICSQSWSRCDSSVERVNIQWKIAHRHWLLEMDCLLRNWSLFTSKITTFPKRFLSIIPVVPKIIVYYFEALYHQAAIVYSLMHQNHPVYHLAY